MKATKDLKMGWSFTFQKDNNTYQLTRAATKWFKSKNIHMLEWSNQSPGLNPDEKVLQELKITFCSLSIQPNLA